MFAENVLGHTDGEPLRPFLIERDLSPLADLIEIAFQDELERTGNPVVTEMRRLARLGPLLWLVGGSTGLLPPLMDGYVWVEDGALVGNASLTCESRAQGLWSISNVAVLPAYRRRGIARRLMEATIRRAVDRGARRLVLEVNADNQAARQLYRSQGFVLYDTVHELLLPRIRWQQRVGPPEPRLRPRRTDDSHGLHELARATTSKVTQEVKPVRLYQYLGRPTNRLAAWLSRLLGLGVRSDWVLEDAASIVAVLQITERYHRDAHRIDIMVHPQHRGIVERALLDRGLYELRGVPLNLRASVSESHPQAVQAFQEIGFETVRVLAQMTLDLPPSRHGVVL